MIVVYLREMFPNNNLFFTWCTNDCAIVEIWTGERYDLQGLDCNESVWIVPGTYHLLED